MRQANSNVGLVSGSACAPETITQQTQEQSAKFNSEIMSDVVLPEGWILSNFEYICDYVQRGKSPKYTKKNAFPVVNQKALRWHGIEEEHLKFVDESQWDSWDADRFIKEGDILWNSTGTGTIGRACYLTPEEARKAKVVDSHVTIVRTNRFIFSKFVFYWIMHPDVQTKISGLYTGSTNQVELSKAIVLATEIPLPPLSEQHQIAAKLDELLAQVDTLKTRLDTLPKILKRFRQSVLAAAVTGKLTEDWRGRSEDWDIALLGSICQFQNGFAFKSDWFGESGEYQVIKLANVKDDYLKLDASPAYLSKEQSKEYLNYAAEVGDLLITMTGTRFKRDYGFVCMVPEELKILVNQRVGRIIPVKQKIIGEFLLLYLRSEKFRQQFFVGETGGVNQGNVGSGHIKSCEIELPTIEEQIEIVTRVEQLFTYADQIEQRVKDAQARVNHLTQAILAKAFRGELTADWREQNPDLISGENSAEALLAKIKAERKKIKSKNSK